MTPPTNIDGTDISGASIDGQDVQEITVDGDTVFGNFDNIILDDFADNVLNGRDTTVAKEIDETAASFRPEWTILSSGGTADVSSSTYRAFFDGANDGELVGITVDTGKGESDFANGKVNFTMLNYDYPGTAGFANNDNTMIIQPSPFVDGDTTSVMSNNSVFFDHNENAGGDLIRFTVYENGTLYRNNVSKPSRNEDVTVQLDFSVSPATARLFYDSTQIVSEPEMPTFNDLYWFIGGGDKGTDSGLGDFHLECDAVKMNEPTI